MFQAPLGGLTGNVGALGSGVCQVLSAYGFSGLAVASFGFTLMHIKGLHGESMRRLAIAGLTWDFWAIAHWTQGEDSAQRLQCLTSNCPKP